MWLELKTDLLSSSSLPICRIIPLDQQLQQRQQKSQRSNLAAKWNYIFLWTTMCEMTKKPTWRHKWHLTRKYKFSRKIEGGKKKKKVSMPLLMYTYKHRNIRTTRKSEQQQIMITQGSDQRNRSPQSQIAAESPLKIPPSIKDSWGN